MVIVRSYREPSERGLDTVVRQGLLALTSLDASGGRRRHPDPPTSEAQILIDGTPVIGAGAEVAPHVSFAPDSAAGGMVAVIGRGFELADIQLASRVTHSLNGPEQSGPSEKDSSLPVGGLGLRPRHRVSVSLTSRASAVLGVACGLLLTTGCGSRAEHPPGQRAAVKPALRRECAPIEPRLHMGSAPKLNGGELAPAGASMIRLCRFAGTHAVPPQPLKLVHSADVRATGDVDRLIRELHRLPPMAAAVSCPNHNGSQIVLLLSYPHGQTLVIDVELSGCQTVTNGAVYRIVPAGTVRG